MKISTRQLARVAVVVLSVIGLCTPALCQIPGQLNVADLFIATGNGTYQVWRNSSTTAVNYQFIGSISDGTTNGTAGCATDVAWRLYGTSNPLVGGFPERFAIASPHAVATSAAPNTGETVKSIAIDSFGRLYVGGVTEITQYVDTTTNHTAPPFTPQTLQLNGSVAEVGGAPYVDLLDDNTLVFTNGGPTIFKVTPLSSFLSAATTPLIDTSTSNKPGTFSTIKVLPSWASSPGSLLVANGSSVARFDPPFTLTSVPAATYSVPANPNFTILAIDSNGTSFWAGDAVTGNFYRFRIADGVETGTQPKNTLNIATGGGGTLSGMCVLGGTGAAQAHATRQTATANPATPATPNANTVKFLIPPAATTQNAFKATLVNLTQSVPVTFYSVDFNRLSPTSGSGITDPPSSLQCALDSIDLAQCEAYKIEYGPACGSGGPCDYLDLSVVLPSYNPVAPITPKFFGEMAANETVWLSSSPGDIRMGGGGSTVHSVQEQTGANLINCGTPFVSPKGPTTTANAGSNLNFSVKAAVPPGNCKNGPFATNLQLRLTQVFDTPGGAPQKFGVAATNTSGTTPAGCFAGLPAGVPPSQLCDGTFNKSAGADTFNVGVSTKGLPKGNWIYTFIDDNGQLAAGSIVVTLK